MEREIEREIEREKERKRKRERECTTHLFSGCTATEVTVSRDP